ncbi:MAG: hypothetical protein HN849_11705 [Victivallales bacterium]|nr:hypothetical protein [Victivallales bacterium]
MRRMTMVGTALLCVIAAMAGGGEPGIRILPNKEGVFAYVEDFSTPRFLAEALATNIPADRWTKGSLGNRGPNRHRALTYRFSGGRAIEKVEVRIDQRANARNLGGGSQLFVSPNGLDWSLVAESKRQPADANGWQKQPFILTAAQAAPLTGGNEAWVRLVLDNWTGLKTAPASIIDNLRVTIRVGEPVIADDPQAPLRAQWAELRQRAGWRSISLDCADPVSGHAPHYYEDADGWLQAPGGDHHLAIDEANGFSMQRACLNENRSPLALVAFVQTNNPGLLMARIDLVSNAASTRAMRVSWGGQAVATLDTASGVERENSLFVQLPSPTKATARGLRITPQDANQLTIKRITICGGSDPQWVEKPDRAPGKKLGVLGAYYLPDPPPPAASQAVEGRQKLADGIVVAGMQRLYKEHADFGALRIVVRNEDSAPVRIEQLLLDGKPIDDHYVDFVKSAWDARGVVWYRIRPRILAPRQCGEIYVRFRRRPAGAKAAIKIRLASGGSVEVDVPYVASPLSLDYVTTGPSADTLYVYVRREAAAGGPLAAVRLDGEEAKDTKVYGADFPGGVALAVVKLRRPLQQGEYHTVGATAAAGHRIAGQFRVLPFRFVRSSIHIPSEKCEEMHMNLAMWHKKPEAACRTHNIFTTSPTQDVGVGSPLHSRVAFVIGPDEPDARDNRGGGYRKGLGSHARRLAHAGWQELIERFSPHAASWIIMNGTVRPLNWSVYGRFADITSFDPYPVNFYGGDHAYVRESLNLARQTGAPKRMFACLEAFGWSKGQGVPAKHRGPLPAEYRQNVVQAIGCGMKGLTSWVYVNSAGGWQLSEPAKQEIANMNALIEHIEGDLLLGTPAALGSSDAGTVPTGVVGNEAWPKDRVAVATLLCGPDTLVVTAANHIPASRPKPPTIQPAKDVTVTVDLPDYLASVAAFEATPQGLVPFPCALADGKALLNIPTLEAGRVFVLRRK